MKLAAPALPKALATGLKPVYLILGEEPLAAIEAADSVRAAARKAGYAERVPMFAEAGFRWASLAAEGMSQSLFADKRLLDLKIPNGKPGNEGSRALIEYAKSPPADTLLMVTAMNADWNSAKAAWVKALEKAGVMVECKPLSAAKMPQWVTARLRSRKLQAPAGAVALIAEYAQGNLLAAAQVVERLALATHDGVLNMEAVQATLVDESRFSLFELVDSALAGERGKMLHILERLRETGTADALLLWALARELRTLEALAWAAEQGGPGPNIFPPARRSLVARAAKRRNARGWQALLAEAAVLDRAMKGRADETAIVLMERLLIAMASSPRTQAA